MCARLPIHVIRGGAHAGGLRLRGEDLAVAQLRVAVLHGTSSSGTVGPPYGGAVVTLAATA